MVQGIDANGIDEAGDQRLDHAAVAAVNGRLLDLLGRLDRAHRRLQAVGVDGELLVAGVGGLDALQAAGVGRRPVEEVDHVHGLAQTREVDQRLALALYVEDVGELAELQADQRHLEVGDFGGDVPEGDYFGGWVLLVEFVSGLGEERRRENTIRRGWLRAARRIIEPRFGYLFSLRNRICRSSKSF